jgi:putative nucleotidyltransferase with HDIG domain
MLRNAPGSYQHSLQVANLAEQAAESIGADSLLVRVGAIFHDCGKAQNPQFFIENQVQENLDPHDDINPVMSARTIIKHVTDGVELAKKHRLPNRIIDFIREHHGTMYTHYQYSQAVKEAEDPESIDKSLFTYPGPKPQSRETALLMLADGTEARPCRSTKK